MDVAGKPVLWSAMGKKNSNWLVQSCLLEGRDTGSSVSKLGFCHKLASWIPTELCDDVLPSLVLKALVPISERRPETLTPGTVQTLIERLNQNDFGKLT